MGQTVRCRDGHEWVQRGNRSGHCMNCHQTYYGEVAWNKHYYIMDGVRQIICRSPVPVEDKWWLDEYGQWHYGRRLTDEEKERIWG